MLGRLAVRAGLITQDQLLEALDEQQKYMREGGEIPRLGDVLVSKGFVTSEQLDELLNPKVAPSVPNAPVAEALSSEVQSIGGYELVEKVGADAYGPVYKAKNEKTGDIVTLKVMSQSVMQTPEFKEQFIEVTRRGAVLNHPNIRRVHTVGTSKGHFFYTSQWVEGTSLRQILTERGKLGIQPATRIALTLAKALRFGHERSIVHGDLRPSNIIITINGDVKIAEFGVLKDTLGNLSRLLNTTSSVGFYISPEQVVGDRAVDDRADIYSLGAVFYHALTGRPPFEGDSPLKSLTRLSQEDFMPPHDVVKEIPPELSDMVEKMLEVEPDYRYQRMAEVEEALEQILRSGLIAEAAAIADSGGKEEALAPVGKVSARAAAAAYGGGRSSKGS
ncbi:protein kinase, partial [Planctomycetota bacterium]